MRSPTTPLHQKDTLNSLHLHTSPAPSVVVVVVLGHEDVVLLQHRREVLADLGPNVQEGHHDHGDADESEGSLVCCPADDNTPPKITETTGLVHQSGSGVGSFIGAENTLRLSRLRRVYFQHTASPQTLGFNSS